MLDRLGPIACALVLAGCSSRDLPPGGDAPTSTTPAACTFLEGKTFVATEDRECGLGPSGPVPCRWRVTIDPDGGATSSYRWSHSDVEESGTLSCVGPAITVTPGSSATLAASFDSSTSVLHWDDLDYE